MQPKLVFAGDLAVPLILVAVLSTLRANGPQIFGTRTGWPSLDRPGAYVFALLGPLVIGAVGGYRDRRAVLPALATVGRLVLAAAVTAWIVGIIGALSDAGASFNMAIYGLATLPIWWAVRVAVNALAPGPTERVLVVGSGLVARRVASLAAGAGHDIIGSVDDEPSLRDDGSTVLGSFADLPRLVREKRISRVLVAFSPRRDEDLVRVLRECDASGVDVDIVPRLFEYLGMEAYISTVGDLPVLHVRAQRAGRAAKLAKRSLDVAIASILGLALLPVIAVVALSIAVTDGRPIIYRQARIGRGGREFAMLKFRTMLPDADEIGLSRIDGLTQGTINVADAVERLKPDHDPRITRLGRFLRRSSLDELPQLWNVLRNEMSLVGPRPLRAFEVDALDAWQLVRQDVRPGITGLWQVLGRSSIEWDDRMQLDYTYVRHWNAWYDLKILARTVPAVFRRHGAR